MVLSSDQMLGRREDNLLDIARDKHEDRSWISCVDRCLYCCTSLLRMAERRISAARLPSARPKYLYVLTVIEIFANITIQ